MANLKMGPMRRTSWLLRSAKYFIALAFLSILWAILVPSPGNQKRRTREASSHLSSKAMAAEVRLAFAHAYGMYEKYAFGHDELKPLTKSYKDNFNGWGVTIYDTLDTLLIMDLNDQFNRAMTFIERAKFTVPKGGQVPFFETVIRYLGGLLSAYALSKDHRLLARASDLGTFLLPAFNTTSGFPAFALDEFNNLVGPEIMPLSEIASFQLEYLYLGHATGRKEFMWVADRVQIRLTRMPSLSFGGMPVSFWHRDTGRPTNQALSVGSGSDSGIEYLLKTYLLSDKQDSSSLKMYLRSAVHIFSSLLYVSPDRQFLYATDIVDGNPSHRFEHLSCFLGGLFALASETIPLDNLPVHLSLESLSSDLPHGLRRDYDSVKHYGLQNLHVWAAEGLTETCAMLYSDQESGLAPNEILVRGTGRHIPGGVLWFDALSKWRKSGEGTLAGDPPGVGPVSEGFQGRDYNVRKKEYALRPETVESLYILWKTTRNPRWRNLGWMIFQNIDREARVKFGYATIHDVDISPARHRDEMPSFFLAETLKYLYLLFSDDDRFSLDQWVWNTEAHAFPVFQRDTQ